MKIPSEIDKDLKSHGYKYSPEILFKDGIPSPKAWIMGKLQCSLQNQTFLTSDDCIAQIDIASFSYGIPLISAFAYKNKNYRLIGLHTPVFAGIFELLSQILKYTSFVQGVESNKDLTHEDEGEIDEKIRLVDTGLPASISENQSTLQIIGFCQRLAIEYIYYHELSHHLLGHSGRRFALGASSVQPEISLFRERDMEQRAMEYDADYCASSTIASCCINNNFTTISNVLKPNAHELVGLMSIALYSISVVYLFFESQERKYNLTSPSYPSVMLRLLGAVEAFRHTLLKSNSVSEEGFQEIWERSVTELSLSLNKSGFKNPIIELFNRLEMIESHYENLSKLKDDTCKFRERWVEYSLKGHFTTS